MQHTTAPKTLCVCVDFSYLSVLVVHRFSIYKIPLIKWNLADSVHYDHVWLFSTWFSLTLWRLPEEDGCVGGRGSTGLGQGWENCAHFGFISSVVTADPLKELLQACNGELVPRDLSSASVCWSSKRAQKTTPSYLAWTAHIWPETDKFAMRWWCHESSRLDILFYWWPKTTKMMNKISCNAFWLYLLRLRLSHCALCSLPL